MRDRCQKPIIFWYVIGAAVLLFTTQGHTAIDPATAVAVWLFNEDGGDLAEDLTENALDAEFLDPVKWTDGKFDGGLEFKSGGLVNAGVSAAPERRKSELFYRRMVQVFKDIRRMVRKPHLKG